MKHTTYKLAIFTLLCAGMLPVFGAVNALSVLSATPKGPQQNIGRRLVQVHFNQPVVALSEDSEVASDKCPLQISPAVAGSCRYSGTQTLVFEPTENWPDSTRFTVTLKAGFASKVSNRKLANDYTFSFSSNPIRVERTLPRNNEHWINRTPTLYVRFSQAVEVEKIAPFIKLSSNGQTVQVAVRLAQEEEIKKDFWNVKPNTVVAISPLEKLNKGAKYTLSFTRGLPATTGNIGLEQTFETTFFTAPNLAVLSSNTSGCLPFLPTVNLATPVRMGELYRAAQVTPAEAKGPLPEVDKNTLGIEVINDKTGEAYFRTGLSFLKVSPEKPVTVVLKKGMQDIYGNTLAQDEKLTVTNNGYCPSVDFAANGRGVLESYFKPYLPIELMNIASLPFRGMRFNKNNFIPFDQQKGITHCKEIPLPADAFVGELEFNGSKNRTQHTYLNLGKLNPTAKDSILFSQVQLPRGEGEKPCWVSSTDNLTDIGITFKTSPENILVWVTSLKTGEPLAGHSVELRDADNRVLYNGTTDENGFARADGWEKLNTSTPSWGIPPLYAFVTSPNGDGVMSNVWNDGMELWRFNIDYTYEPHENVARSYLFTDRGIYRPQETVFLKGLLRHRQDGMWRAVQGRGRVVVTDGRGQEILKKEVSLSHPYGSFDVSFDIPPTAASGAWSATFVPLDKEKEDEDARAYISFQVQDVKPAEFNVTLRSVQSNYFGGEEAKFSLAAAYRFGGVLGNAPAKWTLRQSPTFFHSEEYEDYNFTPYFLFSSDDYSRSEDKIILSDSGTLDSKGTLTFTAKMPREIRPQTIYAEASVLSPSNQELFSRTSVELHSSDFYIGAKVEEDHHEQKKPVSVRLVAVTPDDKPVEAVATAEFYKEQWFSVRKIGLSGRLEWVSEKKRTDFPSQTVRIGKKGAVVSFTPPEGGSYYVKLTATDLFGRQVLGGDSFFVYGEGDYYAQKADDDIVKLTATKNEYKVGQTARIQVASPYESARALVTVEREGILDAWITEVKGGADSIAVKIKENYLPNVYVGVLLLQGRTDKPITEKLDLGKPQAKAGYVNLNVISDRKKLQTTVKTDKTSYRPGQTVTVDISTKAGGKGVPAEVTVMAVDEGILALTHYKTPDLFDHFYGSRPLSVFTVDNRFFIIGQRSFGEKGENRGGGGGMSALGGTDVRSNFKFTPFFKANVQTNPKGRAQVSFTLPDNLTSFRVMAVAAGEDTFGSGETILRVSKPLMITANLPRFVRQGDAFKCSAVIHNYEDKKGALTAQAAAEGIVLEGGIQTVTVPLGGSREVSWPCRAENTGEATVAFTVRSAKEQDGVKQTFTVSAVEKEQFLSANGTTQTAQDELLDKPAHILESAPNRVTASLASTALVHLKGAVQYLLLYPYDCLEQQFSKIVPLLMDKKLVQDFGLTTPQQAHETVQKVLDNLAAYQDVSGGMSYWKKQRPDLYVTAYALDVSAQAKAAGFTVPEEVLTKAAAWLMRAFEPRVNRAFDYDARQTDTLKAYSAYVLSLYGKNTQGIFNTLYTKRNSLSTEALSYLLLAAGELKQPATIRQTLAQLLLNRVVYNPTTAYVNGDEKMIYLHADDVTATALMLRAFLQTNTPLDNAPQFAAWLIGQLNAQGAWQNTASNAAAVRALGTYYRKVETQDPHFTATVSAGNDTLFSHAFAGERTELAQAWPFTQIFAKDASARLTFSKQGTGTLYYTVGQVYQPTAFDKPLQGGFGISRTVTTLDGKPVSRLQAGERYKITLTVRSGAGRSFVVLEDFIPAGMEIINTDLATETAYTTAKNSYFTHREIYKDRMAAFADFLPEGTHTFSYEVAATVRGQFAYPAAWVSQLYEPEVFGRTASERVDIL